MRALPQSIRTVAWSALVAFVILAVGQGIWGILLAINLERTPQMPWAVAVMAAFLWLMWQYLSGKWWPRSTSAMRHRHLRARLVSRRTFAWALLAGVLSIFALSGCWIVLFQLVKMPANVLLPANVLPDASAYPLWTTALMLAMASLVSPFTEEAAFRGYCQSVLERQFPATAAIAISSLLFALAHLTHGFFLPKLFVYFLAGAVFGLMAYLTKSILPGIAIHIMADLTFFTLVWPYDAARALVWEHGADGWFWLHIAQVLVFTPLAILALIRLAKTTEPAGVKRGTAARVPAEQPV
jgi:membrane protease YdiL (CAAX protease family)